MAASIRTAATRLLRPAVLPGAGAGLRRLVHTEQQNSMPHLVSQIKQTKEELYDLVAKAKADSTATWFERRLLWRLCTQVEPRPNDPQWRKLTRNKKLTAFAVLTAFLVSSGHTFVYLAGLPKIVKYDGYRVTTESLPMLQERLRKQDGYQTAGGVHKQEKMQQQMG